MSMDKRTAIDENLADILQRPEATVKRQPTYDGDGYSYGGESILCIGQDAIPFGNNHWLAEEIAHVWNAAGPYEYEDASPIGEDKPDA